MAKNRSGKATVISPGVKTTRAIYSTPSERFTPNWDMPIGADQEVERARVRYNMGQKMTPTGAGRAVKKNWY